MENYTLERLREDLDNGFGIYFDYNNNRYLVHKVTENCYSQELITIKEKSPHARMSLISSKVLKEMFPYIEDIEYEVWTWKNKQGVVAKFWKIFAFS